MTGSVDPRPSGRRLAAAVLAAVVGAGIAGVATASVAGRLAPQWSSDVDRLAPVVIAAVYSAAAAVVLLVLGRTRAPRRGQLAVRSVDLRDVGLGVLVWGGAYLGAAALYAVLGRLGGPTASEAAAVLMSVGADNGRLGAASPTLTAVILLRVLVLSPLVEELVFRGALFTWLRTRLSAGWTVLLTGVGFGLVHGSPTFVPLAVVVGLAAGWVRERTGSVLATVAVHALQSAVVVGASFAITGWDAPALLG